MKKIVTMIVLCVAGLVLHAQTPGDLLKETTQAYLDAENLSMDVVVHTYATSSDPGTLLGNGLIRKSGGSYYSKFLTDELIVNKNCTVILDHQEKTITWYDAEKNKDRNKKDQEIPNLDSLSNGDSIVYAGLKDGKRNFLFYSRNPEAAVRLTEVAIDDQSHFILQITYYYRDNSAEEALDMYKVVIEYTNISTERPADSFFSEKKYLVYSKGIPSLTASYSKYKLIIAPQP